MAVSSITQAEPAQRNPLVVERSIGETVENVMHVLALLQVAQEDDDGCDSPYNLGGVKAAPRRGVALMTQACLDALAYAHRLDASNHLVLAEARTLATAGGANHG